MKKCPFCAEEVSNNAESCKYCGEMLLQDKKKEDVKDHLNITIQNFKSKKESLKIILRYTISILFIIAGIITYNNSYGSTEIPGALLVISGGIGFYISTLIP